MAIVPPESKFRKPRKPCEPPCVWKKAAKASRSAPGTGTFADAVEYAAATEPLFLFSGDLDGDKAPDLVVVNAPGPARPTGGITIMKNIGDGAFSPEGNYRAGIYPVSVIAGDLDGDNDMDLAVANSRSSSISVLLNNGNGTFAAGEDYGTGITPTSLSIADLDRDGDQDIIVANRSSNTVSVLKNRTNTGCTLKRGDLNHDCFMTVEDIILEMNCAILNVGDCRLELTDVNCNGAVTGADVVVLLRAVFLNAPLPCS